MRAVTGPNYKGTQDMPLRLEITSRHRQSLGERGVKEFGVDGGTIGRSLESDWVLPDSQRYLSSRHASIDFRSGSYYLVDTSTNGVYINDSHEPVGKGKPQRLFNGDRLQMGEYEMRVQIEELEDTGEQLADRTHIDPVDRAQQVEAPDPTACDMVDAHILTGVGIEALLSEEAEAEAIKSAAEKAAASLRLEDDAPPAGAPKLPAEEPKERRPAPAKTEPGTRPAEGKHGSAPLGAFFRGAGLAERRMDEKSTELILHRLGQLMRELVVGINEALHLRAEQKNTLRLPHTTIQPSNNNPLKFSAGVDEALDNLFFKRGPEYLSAVDAVREAFADIRTHQQVLLSAVQIALIDYVERLDPDELEQKFDRGGKRAALIGGSSKLKYWELYRDLYQIMAQHPPGDFPQVFAEELSRAYEQELARLGRGQQPSHSAPKAKAG